MVEHITKHSGCQRGIVNFMMQTRLGQSRGSIQIMKAFMDGYSRREIEAKALYKASRVSQRLGIHRGFFFLCTAIFILWMRTNVEIS